MTKQKELKEKDSCFSKARDDERMFILLERDVATPATIRFWAKERLRLGKNQQHDPQIKEALALADEIAVLRGIGSE